MITFLAICIVAGIICFGAIIFTAATSFINYWKFYRYVPGMVLDVTFAILASLGMIGVFLALVVSYPYL